MRLWGLVLTLRNPYRKSLQYVGNLVCQSSRRRPWPTSVRLGIGPPLTAGRTRMRCLECGSEAVTDKFFFSMASPEGARPRFAVFGSSLRHFGRLEYRHRKSRHRSGLFFAAVHLKKRPVPSDPPRTGRVCGGLWGHMGPPYTPCARLAPRRKCGGEPRLCSFLLSPVGNCPIVSGWCCDPDRGAAHRTHGSPTGPTVPFEPFLGQSHRSKLLNKFDHAQVGSRVRACSCIGRISPL
jgi:hypothetical protein